MAQLNSTVVTGDLAVIGDVQVMGEIKAPASDDGQKGGTVYIKYGEDGTLYISNAPIS